MSFKLCITLRGHRVAYDSAAGPGSPSSGVCDKSGRHRRQGRTLSCFRGVSAAAVRRAYGNSHRRVAVWPRHVTAPALQQRPGVKASGARAGPASPAAPAAEPAPGGGDADARRGARFEEMKARERGGREPGVAAGAAGAGAPAAAGAAPPPEAPAQPPAEAVKKAASFVDVVRTRLRRFQSIGLGYRVKGRCFWHVYVHACTKIYISLLCIAKAQCLCALVLGSVGDCSCCLLG